MARTKVAPATKSAQARAMFTDGKTVVQVQHDLHIGYAFAYGIAKRMGLAGTAANRRRTRSVSTTDAGLVEVVTSTGIVIVDPTTGKVTRRKIK